MKKILTLLTVLIFAFTGAQDIINQVLHRTLDEASILALTGATTGDTYVSTDTNKVYTIAADGTAFLDENKEVVFVTLSEPLQPNLPQPNLDLLRYGRTAPYAPTLDEVNQISGFISDSGFSGRYFQTYYLDIPASNGLMETIVQNSSLLYLYFYYTDFRASGTFPEIPAGSQIRQMVFDYSYQLGSDDPFPLPASWNNLTYTNRLFFRRCGLSVAQVDSMVTQIESLVNNGMSSDASNLFVYMNLTGTGANAALTVATATANGWTSNSNYITKVINGKTVRIYHN